MRGLRGARLLQAVLLLAAVASAATGRIAPIVGDRQALEPLLEGRTDILFFGGYETTPWFNTWGVDKVSQGENCTITADPATPFQGRSLAARYPEGSHGGDPRSKGGCQYYARFAGFGLPPAEELYLRYYVRFAPDFQFVKGGKLPGLAGGTSNSGGNIPSGRDGFSVRLMWRRDGRVVIYAYLPTSLRYGTDFAWDGSGTWRPLFRESGPAERLE